jgi:hypothetical protein
MNFREILVSVMKLQVLRKYYVLLSGRQVSGMVVNLCPFMVSSNGGMKLFAISLLLARFKNSTLEAIPFSHFLMVRLHSP